MRRLHRTKRLVAALGVLLAAQAAAPQARAGAFGDMAGHWAMGEVQAAVDAGLVRGYPDGTYRPEESVTRAQFITLLARVQGLTPKPGTGGFMDLEGHWLAEQGWIQAAVDARLVEPVDYGDARVLQPDRPLNRVEAAVLSARATNRLGAALTLSRAPLLYVDELPAWTTGYAAAMHSAGVLRGSPDGRFGPADLLTRAQAAAVALRALQAAKAREVPVWEANSWSVASRTEIAHQVTASPNGTLYWLNRASGEIWRMVPGGEPTLFYTGLEDRGDRAWAATDDAVYIADQHQILRITADGQMTVLAGSETHGYRNGVGTEARFWNIGGLCTDPGGNLYVTDGADELGRVRKVDSQGRVNWVAGLTPQMAAAVAGGGWPLTFNNLTDGADGPAYLASFPRPTACAADGAGNVFVVAPGNAVRRVAPDGTVSRVAGSKAGLGDGSVDEAGFGEIRSLSVDSWGDLWLADGALDRVRRITPDGHVYTVAGSGGSAHMMTNWFRDRWWASWSRALEAKDGPGPESVLPGLRSLTSAGGRLYFVDDTSKLRVISGHTGWYSPEQSMVLQPKMDDPGFWAESKERFAAETVRLPVALYGPAEAVGLKVDGQVVHQAHHPRYTLKWEAAPGTHQIVPMVRRPDGTWHEGLPRTAEVAAVGGEQPKSSHRDGLVAPSGLNWLQGTVELRAISYWKPAEIRVDGKAVARGSGLISVMWDSTTVPDGIHVIEVVADGEPLMSQREVRVANGGLPERLPEVAGWTLFIGSEMHVYQGPLLPGQLDSTAVVPLRETAGAAGFTVAWDPGARLFTLRGQGRTATLHADSGETSGMLHEPGNVKVELHGDDARVDMTFFLGLTGLGTMVDHQNAIVVLR